MQRFKLLLSAVLVCVLAASLFADTADDTPLPIGKQPGYVIELSDIITLEVKGVKDPTEFSGNYFIAPDGFITLGNYGRVSIRGLTLDECGKAIRLYLTKMYPSEFSDTLNIIARIAVCGKQYYVIFLSETGSEVTIPFSYTGHETLVSAMKQINGLAPDCNPHLHVMRPVDGKSVPIEVTTVNYSELCQNTAKDVPLKANDRILIREKFHSVNNIVRPIVAMPTEKTATAFSAESCKKPKRIAKTVRFDGTIFPVIQLVDNGTGMLALEKSGISSLICQVKDEVSISTIICGKDGNGGYWLILFGNEDIVEELHAVFKEIADSVNKKEK